MKSKKVSNFMHEKVLFWQFFRNWLICWIGHALLVQPSISAHRKWPEMVVSAFTNQVWTNITIRSYAQSNVIINIFLLFYDSKSRNWSLKQNHEIEGITNSELTKCGDLLYSTLLFFYIGIKMPARYFQ